MSYWRIFLRKHSRDAKKKGWCEQCQYPWFDGICTCGHANEPEVIEAAKVFFANEKFLKVEVSRPAIPCGQVMGHGEHCCSERPCSSCVYILYLEEKLGIKPEEENLLPANELEEIWEEKPGETK